MNSISIWNFFAHIYIYFCVFESMYLDRMKPYFVNYFIQKGVNCTLINNTNVFSGQAAVNLYIRCVDDDYDHNKYYIRIK